MNTGLCTSSARNTNGFVECLCSLWREGGKTMGTSEMQLFIACRDLSRWCVIIVLVWCMYGISIIVACCFCRRFMMDHRMMSGCSRAVGCVHHVHHVDHTHISIRVGSCLSTTAAYWIPMQTCSTVCMFDSRHSLGCDSQSCCMSTCMDPFVHAIECVVLHPFAWCCVL